MGSGGKEKETKQKKKPGRVPTSCAECRRLKLRCDRNVPCEKCVSRGCGSICPNGVLTPGKNNRMILANTEQLHDRIDTILARNRELENALQTLQATVSDQPHPLLAENDRLNLRINIQQGSSSGPSTSSSSKSPSISRVSPAIPPSDISERLEDDHRVINEFGTLVIDKGGGSRYLGRNSRSEYLAQAGSRFPHNPRQPPQLPKHILDRSLSEFGIQDETLLPDILDLLPPRSEALHLCELYLESGKHLHTPISRWELSENVLTPVYRARQYRDFELLHHKLSLLFTVLAIAEFFNLEKPAYSAQANNYYHLARVVLQLSPPTKDSSLEAIQSLIHMAQFVDLSESTLEGAEIAFTHIRHAINLAQSMGLFFNSSRWKIGPELSQKRHDLFWRLFLTDSSISNHLGRPPGIIGAHFDVPPPVKPKSMPTNQVTFFPWNVQFMLHLSSMDEGTAIFKQPAYSSILDIDSKIRDFDVPEKWKIPADADSLSPDNAICCWLTLAAKETALLSIHRENAAQALQESHSDLQEHRYTPSVLSMYRSAWRLGHGLALTWAAVPKVLARINVAWSHGLSAAILLCLIVVRAPMSHFSAAALDELDNLESLFDSAASTGCQAAFRLLPLLQKLRRKARSAGKGSELSYHPEQSISTITVAEIERLNGKTYLLSDRPYQSMASSTNSLLSSTNHDPTRSRATSITISDNTEATNSYGASPTPLFHLAQRLHPTLSRDLRQFNLGKVAPMNFFDSRSPDDGAGDADIEMSMSPSPTAAHDEVRTKDASPSPLPTGHLYPQPRRSEPYLRPQTHRDPYSRGPSPVPPSSESPHLPTHNQYFHATLHQEPFAYAESRRSAFSLAQLGSPGGFSIGLGGSNTSGSTSGFPPGFQSGWGSFTHSPIVLDSSWTSLVEQLGF